MKIAQKIKLTFMGFMMLAFGTAGLVALAPNGDAYAKKFTCADGAIEEGTSYDAVCNTKDHNGTVSQTTDLMSTLNTIINVVIGLIGFVAVAMVIVGGVQYSTSSGDTSKATKARNTIMYGIIGLVIALLAYAIVNFVLTNIAGS